MVVVPIGALMLVGGYLSGGMQSQSELVRGLMITIIASLFLALVLGTTFFRIKNNRIFYITCLFEWHRMGIDEIERIVLVPRFWFTKKVSAVQIERKNPGIFPGMLISRDAFPDDKIAALISHLKRLNPSIELDEGVQEILTSQGE